MVTPPLCDPYVAHGWGIGKSENEYLWSAKVAMENARICMWNLPVTSFFLWISDWNESVDEGVEVDKYPEIVRIWRITCTKKRKNVGNHTCTLYIYIAHTPNIHKYRRFRMGFPVLLGHSNSMIINDPWEVWISGTYRLLIAPIENNWDWWTGWWFQTLWKIWKSVRMIIPNIWKNKNCSKPPTSESNQWIPLLMSKWELSWDPEKIVNTFKQGNRKNRRRREGPYEFSLKQPGGNNAQRKTPLLWWVTKIPSISSFRSCAPKYAWHAP
jgi:hypothetical protein